MIPRRVALFRATLGLLGSLWTLVSCAPLSRGSGAASKKSPVLKSETPPTAAVLEQELVRLGQRVDSEQGIPMFLVCEDLTSGEVSRSGGFDERGESEALAETFQEYAEIFRQIRPAATEEDVPKLMEILADRDFGGHDDPATP